MTVELVKFFSKLYTQWTYYVLSIYQGSSSVPSIWGGQFLGEEKLEPRPTEPVVLDGTFNMRYFTFFDADKHLAFRFRVALPPRVHCTNGGPIGTTHLYVFLR